MLQIGSYKPVGGNMLQIDADSYKRAGKYATDRHRFLPEIWEI
jgi:hypothetical protein